MKTALDFPLNAPKCKYGYPQSQLQEEMTFKQYMDFMNWMRGQTFTSCDGFVYDYELRKNVPSDCGPHGYVYYSEDVERFLRGLPVID